MSATQNRGFRGLSMNAPEDQANLGPAKRFVDYILQPNSGSMLYSPSWNKTSTCIRILPHPDWQNPDHFEPTYFTGDNGEPVFGQWIKRYWGVKFFGGNLNMLVADDSADMNEIKANNPVSMLTRSVTEALTSGKGDRRWVLLTGIQKKKGVLEVPKRLYFVQCFLFEHKSLPQYKRGEAPRGARDKDGLVVMALSATAGGALLKAMRTEGAPDYVRDPIDPNAGAFVYFFENGTNINANVSPAVGNAPMTAEAYYGSGGSAQQDAGDREFSSYQCEIHQRMVKDPSFPSAISHPSVARKVLAKSKPWDAVLRLESKAGQIRAMCVGATTNENEEIKKALCTALVFTFGGQPELLTDEVHRIAREVWPELSGEAPPVPAARTGRELMQEPVAARYQNPSPTPVAPFDAPAEDMDSFYGTSSESATATAPPAPPSLSSNPAVNASPAATPVYQGFTPPRPPGVNPTPATPPPAMAAAPENPFGESPDMVRAKMEAARQRCIADARKMAQQPKS